MNTAKSKGSKARPGFVRSDWHERVEPAFASYWRALKQNRSLPKIKNEREADRKFHQWFREFAAASRALNEARARLKNPLAAKIQQAVLKPLDIEGSSDTQLLSSLSEQTDVITYPQNPESSAIFRKIVFLKYGITFRELIHQIDIEKSAAAHRRLMAVHRDFWRFLSGIELKDLKLKFSVDHFEILTQGFDFGLDKLTPDELADCLDEICPCGLKHSPEYYKKLRTWIKKARSRLI